MRRFFDFLVRLYPAEYTMLFGEEIRGVLHEAAADKRRQGATAFVGFIFRETLGLLGGLAAEWLAKVTTFNGYMSGAAVATRTAVAGGAPTAVAEAEKRIQLICKQMDHAIAHHDFERARFFSIEDRKERAKLEQLREKSATE
jgi:hypothetical protein